MLKKVFYFIVVLVLISSGANGQRYFTDAYDHLQDSIYFPEISNHLNESQFDSAIISGERAFAHYWQQKQYDQAIYLFNNAMYLPTGNGLREITFPKLQSAIEKMQKEIDTLNPHYGITQQILAFAYKFEQKMPQAINHYHITESIYEKLGVEGMQLWGLYESLGSAYVHVRQPLKGYNYLEKALNGFREKNMPHEVSHIYLEMARAMNMNDQAPLALGFNKKALGIIRHNNPQGFNHVVVPSNMASIYLSLEQNKKAIEMAQYADSVMRTYHSPDNLYYLYFSILANQGIAYRNMGEYAQARTYFETLIAQITKYLGPKHPVVGNGWMEMGKNYADNMQYDSALACYKKVTTFQPPSPNLYGDIAMIYSRMSQPDSSIHYHQMALTMLSGAAPGSNDIPVASGINNPMFGFELSEGLMRQYFSRNNEHDFEKGLSYAFLADSLMTILNETTLIGGFDKSTASSYHRFASAAISHLFKHADTGQPNQDLESAVYFMSRAKAIKLMGQLNQVGIVEHDNANPLQYQQVELMAEIRRLENEILATKQQEKNAQMDRLEEELFDKRIAAFENSARLKKIAAGDNLSFGSQKLCISKVQDALDNEMLISYHLAEDTLFAIGFTSAKVIPVKVAASELPQLTTSYFRAIKTGASVDEAGAKLYGLLLAPFEEQLAHHENLVIIPDGILHQIPFEAFRHSDRFLVEEHAISYHYSLPLWIKSSERKQRMDSFLAFAPVYDNKQLLAENSPVRTDTAIYRNFDGLRSGNQLAPLFYSEKEVDEVARMFNQKESKVNTYLHNNATEANFKNEYAAYDVLHIATHGYSSKRDPELSGLLFYEEDSDELTNDGKLYSGEIYGLQLQADLVVLSACKSGYGKIVQGEGVLALPRGFLYSGANNVLASLWDVNDQRTRELVTSFYKHALQGNTYKDALRNARLQMIQRGELPIDWAGFVLIGR